MAGITLSNLNKRWGDFVGVKDFDLEIADQEFLVLLGPSGCGKTTTMRMIAGLEEVTSGTIHIGENCVNDLDPKDRDVAMVFQSYALYPNMTVYENIQFPLKVRNIPKSEHHERVMKASDMVELGDFLHRKPAELSGGQRQRVAIGRAIIMQAPLLLADEPTGNLDTHSGADVVELLEELNAQGITLIVVTHDMALGQRAKRRLRMVDGAIVSDDTFAIIPSEEPAL